MTYYPPDIEELLKAIHDGRITMEYLPEPLYRAIAGYLKKGLYKGYGGTLADFSGVDLELLQELRANIYMFSAAKTYQEVREMTDLLVSGNGVVPFREFKAEALKIYDKYNVAWLEAEYNTAIGQAQMASKWREIMGNADILPYLRYDAIGDACPICKPLDGIVAPVNAPIWRTASPLNHFNCFCVLLQEPAGVNATDPSRVVLVQNAFEQRVPDEFKMNPYFDKVIFNDKASYFTNIRKEDVNLAMNNFNLPIPKND